MEERWEFSPVDAAFYCNSQLSNNPIGGPGLVSEFRRLLLLLFGSLRLSCTPRVQEIFALSSFLQPSGCCRISRLLCFQFKAAFS